MFIDLQNTNFVLGEVVNSLPTTMAFHKSNFKTLLDFGTVFIGLDLIDKKSLAFKAIMDCSKPQGNAPIFIAPKEWKFPQLLKALGAFKSSSQAIKNGWNKDIEPGITEIVIRINKQRGVLWIHKINSNSPWLKERINE